MLRIQDFIGFATLKSGNIRVNPVSTEQWVRLVGSKLFWVAYRFVLPACAFQVPLPELLGLGLVTELASGYWLAFNFQVSHISDAAHFPMGREASDAVHDEWAVSQSQVERGLVARQRARHVSQWRTQLPD